MKPNTDFYHRHIQTNIAKLDQRKDKYVHYRIEFLKQFCEPIQDKIKTIELEIEKYKKMRDTQQEVIENQPDIASLKKQIESYQHTQHYFNTRLDQYEKKKLELSQYNKDLAKQIEKMRKYVKTGKEEMGFQLPKIIKSRLKTVNEQREQNENKEVEQSKSFVLPSIKNHSEGQNLDSRQSSKLTKAKKILSISQKIQRSRLVSSSDRLDNESQTKQATKISEKVVIQTHEDQHQKKKQVQQFRQRITKFNKIQSLFNDCFETKKNSVQRSVSQLQSKLIKNREEFLNTCQAISSKQNKVSFQQFTKLSGDQILTLFISFVWLNKKIRAQFAQKRKLIMDLIGRLPKLQNY